jgi:hypothetical protein
VQSTLFCFKCRWPKKPKLGKGESVKEFHRDKIGQQLIDFRDNDFKGNGLIQKEYVDKLLLRLGELRPDIDFNKVKIPLNAYDSVDDPEVTRYSEIRAMINRILPLL